MDIITAFVLGMLAVVVTALAVVAVVGFVKANKAHDKIKEVNELLTNVYQEMHQTSKESQAILDSRLDKLENRIVDKIKETETYTRNVDISTSTLLDKYYVKLTAVEESLLNKRI